MQNSSAREPLRVTQEAVDAYERWSGFHGIGKVMVERGVWVIVSREAMAHTDWNNSGCTGASANYATPQYRDRNREDISYCGRGDAP